MVSDSKKEDICPNCGAACYASDVLCPVCGSNLDELYERLPANGSPAKSFLGLEPEPAFLIKWVAGTAIGLLIGEMVLSVLLFGLFDSLLPRRSPDQDAL